MSSVKREVEFAAIEIRPMHELDVPAIVAIERAAYQFPWSEGIFRDCLRVGYVCRVIDVGGTMAVYGIMSIGAGEAHIPGTRAQPTSRAHRGSEEESSEEVRTLLT